MKIKDFENLPTRPGGKRGNAILKDPLTVIKLPEWTLKKITVFNIRGETNGIIQTEDGDWSNPDNFVPVPGVEQLERLLEQLKYNNFPNR